MWRERLSEIFESDYIGISGSGAQQRSRLCEKQESLIQAMPLSSSGLGRMVLSLVTRVRIPLRVPISIGIWRNGYRVGL